MPEKVVETTVEAVAPVVNAGTLDYKKVALIAGGVAIVGGCGFIAYRMIKKRKAEKEKIVIESPAETGTPEIPVE